MLTKILTKIKSGATTLDTIAKDLDMNKSTLEAMIEFLVREGYLEEIECSGKCMICAEKCVSPPPITPIKMYVLTPKGRKYIDNERRNKELK